jgi:hypothetical protein
MAVPQIAKALIEIHFFQPLKFFTRWSLPWFLYLSNQVSARDGLLLHIHELVHR